MKRLILILPLLLAGCWLNQKPYELPLYNMTWLYEQYITKQHICYSYKKDKYVIISGDIEWFSMDDTRYVDYDDRGNKILFWNVNLTLSGDYLNCKVPKDNYFDEKTMDRVIYKNNL
jgi:hypothetical protein